MYLRYSVRQSTETQLGNTYPEIDVEVSGPTKLPITDLERDCHSIISMKLFKETFFRVRAELNIMCGDRSKG
jgi:hypothetical protein